MDFGPRDLKDQMGQETTGIAAQGSERPGEGHRERLTSVADLLEIAGAFPPTTVVVAGGDRTDDLRLVESARDHGIVDRVILVGHKERMARAVSEVGIEVRPQDIVHGGNDDHVAAATVELIKAGGVDIVLKGNISTPIINRHMLPLAVRPTVSLASIFDAAPIAGGRPIILTDAGVTTVCNFGRLVGLIRNAVDVARAVMNIPRPRVAILSANEKQIASLPSTWLGAELTKRAWPDAVVYGPLSFDLATDPGSVSTKGLPGVPAAREVAGQADVLVCPGIDAANVLYKTITAMVKYGQASLAGITVGFPVPYIILSRADTVATRLESIALCSVYVRKSHAAHPHVPRTSRTKLFRVLVINPGSMSIKAALYENDRCVHETEEARVAGSTATAADRRREAEGLKQIVQKTLAQWNIGVMDAVVARGGIMPRPGGKLAGGTYLVAELRDGKIEVETEILSAVLEHPEKDHASNLGIPIAAALAQELGVPAYTVDPVVVDEFSPKAEVSGYAPVVRRSTAHALSVRAAARRAAETIGRPLEDIKLVVVHLGGGITVAAVTEGKMADNNIALLGGGPFTPQRAGQLPIEGLIDLCYSGRFSREELTVELTKRGGLQSYLGEHRMEEIERRIAAGDAHARLVVEAMVYQITKEIGAMFAAAGCDVEAIVLTGGLTRSNLMRTELRRAVERLAPVMIFEGSLEMAALAEGAIQVLSGHEQPLRYHLPEGRNKV